LSKHSTPKRYLVTAALPYANGPKHIGHLAGAYLPADIYVRYLRQAGKDVAFICGSDEHGAAITLQALKENTTPKAIVDKYHALLQENFQDLGISFDVYHRTSDVLHIETAQAFFKVLHSKGLLKEKVSEQYFDESAKVFLADRYIIGTCPKCGHDAAYGDQCEKCGSTLSPDELINPHSTLSGNPPIKKATSHWYLPLGDYENWLKEWVLTEHKSDWKAHVYGQCKSWIDAGLQDRAVTRDLEWGVPVPLPDAKGKVLYVWFDAPIGYISATKAWAAAQNKKWEDYWQSNDTQLVHFIGKDNIVFHCIIFPVMLKAHGQFILPQNVPANEFLNLEGDKMSTSRGWSIEMDEYLHDFPGMADALRFCLTSIMPETKDSEFTWKDFQARYNNELADIYGNFLNRATVLTHKYFDGKVPARGTLEPIDTEVLQRLLDLPMEVAANISEYKFRAALTAAMQLARVGNKYMADTEPWKLIKTQPERVATILNVSLQVCAALSIVLEPFLPFSSKQLQKYLGLEANQWPDGKTEYLGSGHQIQTMPILFPKITDEVINRQLEKLKNKSKAKTGVETPQKDTPPAKPAITFEQFQQLDLRVAKVITAEKVKGADRLLQLQLDLGQGITKTVVSGIAQHYTPESLIGKYVTYLQNLEPRKIKGILSEGMILMAEDSQTGKLSILAPEQLIASGSCIS
jgi:methionyl-tRNA synthetase